MFSLNTKYSITWVLLNPTICIYIYTYLHLQRFEWPGQPSQLTRRVLTAGSGPGQITARAPPPVLHQKIGKIFTHIFLFIYMLQNCLSIHIKPIFIYILLQNPILFFYILLWLKSTYKFYQNINYLYILTFRNRTFALSGL